MYRIKNTADDRSKHLLHRTATQFELEPSLGGHRIRLRSYLDITDEHYERVKSVVAAWERKGIVEVSRINTDSSSDDLRKYAVEQEQKFNSEGLRLGGPTFEEWTEKLKLPPESYPPEGFAEVFSPGLVAFRRHQEESKKPAAELEISPVTESQILQDNLVSVQDTIRLEQPSTVSIPPAPTPPQPPAPPINKGVKKKLF